jgi:hypothetical protein
MSAYLTFGDRFPWPTFCSPLTDHDRAVIAELSKAQSTSPEKARARIAKMLIKTLEFAPK